MSEKLSKMQLRSKLLAVLNKYRSNTSLSNSDMRADIEEISSFEDSDYVAKVLFRELETADKQFESVCAFFALEILDSEIFKKYAFAFLEKKELPDEKKFFVISLIKQKGIPFNYDDIDYYVESAEQYANKGVKDFLGDIRQDFEAQIDLMDFYLNITDVERESLILNLAQDFDNDDVAYGFSLLIHLDLIESEFNQILEYLINSKSKYSALGLNFVSKNKSVDFRTFQKIKKALAKFDIKKCSSYDLINNSKPHEAFMSFVDGNSNFSFMFSRKNNENLIDCFFITIEIQKGIVSCMGFSKIISTNYEAIKKRLFCDMPPSKISFSALKSILLHYKNKNKKTDFNIPYEYWVWSKLLDDVDVFNYDVSEYINSHLDTVNLTSENVLNFINSKISSSWFYVKGQNKYIDDLIDEIEFNHIVSLDEIDKLSEICVDKLIQDEEFNTNLKDKLLLQSYASKLSRLKMSSMVAYSLCFSNPFTKLFVSSIIDRTLYYYFDSLISENSKGLRNVFCPKTNFKPDEIEILLAQIEEKWT